MDQTLSLEKLGWEEFVEDAGKCWMCVVTQALDHQTAIEWTIKHALYIESPWKTLKHNLPTHDKFFGGAMYNAN